MGLAPAFSAFLQRLVGKCNAEDLLRLQGAWSLALSAHDGQLRSSGEPYATHPLAVASILHDLLDPGVDALCAALLHDVVEDSDVPLSHIASQFGSDVAHIVDGVSKLDAISASNPGHAKEETLRKLVDAGGQDWRVFAVKLCDRLHNMRTLGSVSAEKRRRVALETYEVLFPLARYMGFHGLAGELEALCLQSMRPWRWRVVSRWLTYKRGIDLQRVARYFDGNFSTTEFSRASRLVAVHNQGVVDSFHRIARNRASRVLFEVPTLTLDCASMAEAYDRVGVFHRQFVFVPASFNSDAPEGYVSTKGLLAARGPVVELVARFPRVSRKPWFRLIAETANAGDFSTLAKTSMQAGQFTRVLRDLVEDKSIIVFSPKGLRVSLPHRSSGFDFAFAIHTELGLHTTAVLVNGIRRDASAELSSGDIVEVVSADAVVARADWEPFLKSPRSRAKLRQWLRDVARADAIELGRGLLSGAFLAANLSPLPEALINNALLASYGVDSVDALFQRIGEGSISAVSVAAYTLDPEVARIVEQSTSLNSSRSVVLDGSGTAGIKFCPHCRPIPGDTVVCNLSSSGALVHRVQCLERGRGREVAEEIVPHWANKLLAPLPCAIRIISLDRRGLLADCAYAIAACEVSVTGVSTQSYVDLDHPMARLEFCVLIADEHALRACLDALSTVDGIQTVNRV
jgi:GTP diphosphokinase / guanosine-3',5'-bis(diphosphate) 3'-diphosphatase